MSSMSMRWISANPGFLILMAVMILSLQNPAMAGSLAAGEKGLEPVKTLKDQPKASPRLEDASNPEAFTEEDLKKLQTQLKDFGALKVNFSQTAYKSLRKKTIVTTGRAFFAKPNLFRWSLQFEAGEEEWIFDGQQLLHYEAALKRATSYKASASRGRELGQIVDMVLNPDHLLSEYRLASGQREGDLIKLVLIPRNPGDIVQTQLTLDCAKNYITQVFLSLRGENTTTFDFTNPQKSKAASSKDLLLPTGVKITAAM